LTHTCKHALKGHTSKPTYPTYTNYCAIYHNDSGFFLANWSNVSPSTGTINFFDGACRWINVVHFWV